jgi:hypothetical protein
MRPPSGEEIVTRTPLERATPMCRLSGLTATSARTFGLIRPSSFRSMV